jgi:hypothetical protein
MSFLDIMAGIYLLILLVSSISTIVLSHKYNFPHHLKTFAYLTAVTFISELSAYLATIYFHNNWRILNFFVLIETLWHMYFFYCIISVQKIKKTIPVLMTLYCCFWVATNIFVVHFFSTGDPVWNSYVIIAESVVTVGLSCAYLYQLIEVDSAFEIQKRPEFWIVLAMLVYYTCQIPYFGAFNLIIKHKITVKQIGFGNLRTLMIVLNDIMYASFIYAYICQVRLMKYRRSN